MKIQKLKQKLRYIRVTNHISIQITVRYFTVNVKVHFWMIRNLTTAGFCSLSVSVTVCPLGLKVQTVDLSSSKGQREESVALEQPVVGAAAGQQLVSGELILSIDALVRTLKDASIAHCP